jgi:hypothetical protein
VFEGEIRPMEGCHAAACTAAGGSAHRFEMLHDRSCGPADFGDSRELRRTYGKAPSDLRQQSIQRRVP